MSTSPEPLRALVDDAAVFPPGNSPLPEAVSAHARHRASAYGGCVGPLLVPASSADALLAVLDAGGWTGRGPLDLGVVARPGTDPAVLREGLAVLAADPRVDVRGAELGWTAGWRRLDLPGDLPLALEVPRERAAQDEALADVRAAVAEGDAVVAKFRTGPTPTWPWPPEDELAAFLVAATTARVPFKLTGGLHHAVRGTYAVDGVDEENHGVLDVLVATAAALEGAPAPEVAALLAVRDARALADLVLAWPDATTRRVRAAFTAYGCCTVTDPLTELADLGLPTSA
ncbi:hypothetical protein [Arthrobacter sp. NEB 688]|uniref:hypothetical protein n=1 Tax=Arthrobacter sp. NEB 688 TaxID=904039 RepID=UPI0015643777|nr:hypothetical protein [Arthrobacter sp. NEB 688]QKE85434.1 hypothetical protein HL663_16840 [Arthrobacter sp. NEB 688]